MSGPVELARASLVADLGKLCLEVVKTNSDYPKMDREKQQMVIDRIWGALDGAVEHAIGILAADERPVIPATVERFAVKDGTVITLEADRAVATLVGLNGALGKRVQILVLDLDPYQHGEQPKAEGNQPALFKAEGERGVDEGTNALYESAALAHPDEAQAGAEAYVRGAPISANPHQAGTAMMAAWALGWMRAQESGILQPEVEAPIPEVPPPAPPSDPDAPPPIVDDLNFKG